MNRFPVDPRPSRLNSLLACLIRCLLVPAERQAVGSSNQSLQRAFPIIWGFSSAFSGSTRAAAPRRCHSLRASLHRPYYTHGWNESHFYPTSFSGQNRPFRGQKYFFVAFSESLEVHEEMFSLLRLFFFRCFRLRFFRPSR